jgi:hypothetical protein
MATNRKIRRLPGFRFEAQAASRENILPRMDVAVFVGFAASGPINVPVVVESAEQFNQIFGIDLPLVWSREKGATVHAYLPPTVRAFFRNGGTRCWIIRTARLHPSKKNPQNRAYYNYFPLSGLAAINFDEDKIANITPAFAHARAMGSWSDGLQIGTATSARAVKFVSLNNSENRQIVTLEISTSEPLKYGELLRLEFDDGTILLLTADEIEDGGTNFPLPIAPQNGRRFVKVAAKRFVWLENLVANEFPNDSQNVSVKMWTRQNDLDSENVTQTFLNERQAELSVVPPKDSTVNKSPKIKLKFTDLAAANAPTAGSLLIVDLADGKLCLQVETVSANNVKTSPTVEILCRSIVCRTNINQPNSTPRVERMAFEIWVKQDENSFTKLDDLAFNSKHERFWGDLPIDENLYRLSEDKKFPAIAAWTQENDAAYFPLAGNERRDEFYVPLFPTTLPENYLDRVNLSGTKLQRDGLEEFDAALFLDDKLENTGLNNLLNDAEFVRYLSPRPRPLWGIHAALAPETAVNAAAGGSPTKPAYANLSLEEATIISVPDALHLGWHREADDREIVSPPHFSPPLRPEWWSFQDCRNPQPERVSEPLWGNFLDCATRVVKRPENLRVEGEISAEKFLIRWNSAEIISSPQIEKGEILKFVLEESATPNFSFPQEIYSGSETEFIVRKRGAGIFYYRVRAEIKNYISDWSDGLAVKVPALENWVSNAKSEYDADVLLTVQRALLRMCAARGDLFAVLDLPEHYDRDEAVRHIATLKTTKSLTAAISKVAPFSADELKALSFGAVYHPWLLTREDGFETARNIPPSGSVAGVMANRAAKRGAWIAPANEILQGVLGLATNFGREIYLDFQDNSINLIRHEPSGFLVLDSDTLSDENDLRSINVRRLLSLLRRLALKHGAEYVFEPNDERFRRQVQRGFASLLDLIFVRGAFAGTTPNTSYQVVVNESVNNFQSIEQGRFIVELRVAPSLPLKFVSVRLIQTGGRSTVTEIF